MSRTDELLLAVATGADGASEAVRVFLAGEDVHGHRASPGWDPTGPVPANPTCQRCRQPIEHTDVKAWRGRWSLDHGWRHVAPEPQPAAPRNNLPERWPAEGAHRPPRAIRAVPGYGVVEHLLDPVAVWWRCGWCPDEGRVPEADAYRLRQAGVPAERMAEVLLRTHSLTEHGRQ